MSRAGILHIRKNNSKKLGLQILVSRSCRILPQYTETARAEEVFGGLAVIVLRAKATSDIRTRGDMFMKRQVATFRAKMYALRLWYSTSGAYGSRSMISSMAKPSDSSCSRISAG